MAKSKPMSFSDFKKNLENIYKSIYKTDDINRFVEQTINVFNGVLKEQAIPLTREDTGFFWGIAFKKIHQQIQSGELTPQDRIEDSIGRIIASVREEFTDIQKNRDGDTNHSHYKEYVSGKDILEEEMQEMLDKIDFSKPLSEDDFRNLRRNFNVFWKNADSTAKKCYVDKSFENSVTSKEHIFKIISNKIIDLDDEQISDKEFLGSLELSEDEMRIAKQMIQHFCDNDNNISSEKNKKNIDFRDTVNERIRDSVVSARAAGANSWEEILKKCDKFSLEEKQFINDLIGTSIEELISREAILYLYNETKISKIQENKEKNHDQRDKLLDELKNINNSERKKNGILEPIEIPEEYQENWNNIGFSENPEEDFLVDELEEFWDEMFEEPSTEYFQSEEFMNEEEMYSQATTPLIESQEIQPNTAFENNDEQYPDQQSTQNEPETALIQKPKTVLERMEETGNPFLIAIANNRFVKGISNRLSTFRNRAQKTNENPKKIEGTPESKTFDDDNKPSFGFGDPGVSLIVAVRNSLARAGEGIMTVVKSVPSLFGGNRENEVDNKPNELFNPRKDEPSNPGNNSGEGKIVVVGVNPNIFAVGKEVRDRTDAVGIEAGRKAADAAKAQAAAAGKIIPQPVGAKGTEQKGHGDGHGDGPDI